MPCDELLAHLASQASSTSLNFFVEFANPVLETDCSAAYFEQLVYGNDKVLRGGEGVSAAPV